MSEESNVKVTNGLGSNIIVNNQPPVQTIKAHSMSATPAAVKVQVEPPQERKESSISFEKVRPEAEAQEEVAASEVSETAEEKPATSAERRDAWKRANQEHTKAIQMQKEAKEMMAKAQHFQDVSKKAATNPVELAKALGLEPQEFLRRFQNEMFNIPNEEVKAQEPTVEERLKQYESERNKEKQAAAQYQSEMIRTNYITTKIMPSIKADPDKFQLLNYNNLEKSAGFIYDMMNDHYQKTGEELSPSDVAEEMENQLQQEFEEKIAQVKKIGKFSKHFRDEEPAPTEEVSLQGSQLGAKKEWAGAKSPVPVTSSKSNDRKSRLERLKKL